MAFPRHQGDSGWLMPEGFHQLLRRYLWLSGFSHINLQAFETSSAVEVVVPDERGKEDETADLFQWSAGDRDSNNGARRVGSIPSVTHTIRSGPSRVEPTSAQEHARHQRQFEPGDPVKGGP
ncbi:hypothetical protein OUZ56_000175 [Daphnia magna]|uniref:Uncharacterized protein n=1 Tax=Daphnia magna TaxID=35525 RepID=A0ABQ9ZYW9_9CRUS|nr:hypothetical protein OUZ56_000175 [Daphnia magna]